MSPATGAAWCASSSTGSVTPAVLAEMAHGRMRPKIPQLREALTGHFEDHHAFLCATMLRRIDALAADITGLDAKIEELVAPFAHAARQLEEITGIGIRSAEEIIAEIGVNMAAFLTAAHLASWAKFAPIDRQSAGKNKSASTGKGSPWLAATIGEVVASLARTDTFLGERYRRLVRRRGKKRAVVAVGNSVLTIVWHLLSDRTLTTTTSASTTTRQRSTSSGGNATSSASSNTSPARKSLSSPGPSCPLPPDRPTPGPRATNNPDRRRVAPALSGRRFGHGLHRALRLEHPAYRWLDPRRRAIGSHRRFLRRRRQQASQEGPPSPAQQPMNA
jgi:hypothetical protein